MILDLGIGQEVWYKDQKAQVVDFSLTHDEDEQEVCVLLRDGTSIWTSAERLYEENPDLVVIDKEDNPPYEDEEDYPEAYEGYDDYDI